MMSYTRLDCLYHMITYFCGDMQLFMFCQFYSISWSDIDECQESKSSCAENAVCKNTIGSFECRCEAGYHGDAALVCEGTVILHKPTLHQQWNINSIYLWFYLVVVASFVSVPHFWGISIHSDLSRSIT